MNAHDKVHKLTPALAQIILAEKKALELSNSEQRVDLLYHIREVKYVLEFMDKKLAEELAQTRTKTKGAVWTLWQSLVGSRHTGQTSQG